VLEVYFFVVQDLQLYLLNYRATNLASQMTQPQNEGSQDSSGLMQNMQSMASAFQQYYSAPPQSSQDTAKPDDKDQVRKDGPN
jgi:hypothetical protein